MTLPWKAKMKIKSEEFKGKQPENGLEK